MRIWKILTSLRLTIILLAFSVALVFFGSLAQVSEGLWNAQERWFKSLIVTGSSPSFNLIIPFFKHGIQIPSIPYIFPGGHLLGILLLINLIAAHAKRFHWSFQKFGIQLTHLGIIMLLVGQLLTDKLAVESHLSFREGETKSYTEHHRDSELVFISDLDDTREEVVSIPEQILKSKAGAQNAKLPFVVRVKEFQHNGDIISIKETTEAAARLTAAYATIDGQYATADSTLAQLERIKEMPGRATVWREALKVLGEKNTDDLNAAVKSALGNPATESRLREEIKSRFKAQMLDAWKRQGSELAYVARETEAGRTVSEEILKPVTSDGAGSRFFAVPMTEDKSMDGRNNPYVIVELLQGGESTGSWLFSPLLREQKIETGGKVLRAVMRPERFYLPYSLKLLETKHEVYQGTEIPKNFQSRILIQNPATGENRETDIYMNNPLRYAGLTFYQYQMGTDQRNTSIKTSTLQVVQNPSWLAPYAGCLVVALGMMWQFLWHLSGFIAKRTGLPRPEMGAESPALKFGVILMLAADAWLLVAAIKNGSGMLLTSAIVSLFVRLVIARELWRGRFAFFIMLLLLVATLLTVPFAIAFRETLGSLLWPLTIAQLFCVASIIIAVSFPKKISA